MTKKELNKLKNSLPRGYRDMIAEQLSCSVTLIDMVFAGNRRNIEIIKVAINIAQTHKEELAELSTKIKDL